MNRCNAGKRLLHGNKRICARCMINKEEREEPFPSLFICPLFDSPPSILRNIARIRARLYLVPRYSCRSNAAVLQTWSIPSFLRGTLRKIWKLIVDVSIPKKEWMDGWWNRFERYRRCWNFKLILSELWSLMGNGCEWILNGIKWINTVDWYW